MTGNDEHTCTTGDLVAVLEQLNDDASVLSEVFDCSRSHDVSSVLFVVAGCASVGQYQHGRRAPHLCTQRRKLSHVQHVGAGRINGDCLVV